MVNSVDGQRVEDDENKNDLDDQLRNRRGEKAK